MNGIDGWAEKAIAGRGILVDYASWAAEQKIQYDATATRAITANELKAILTSKGIQPRPGDILILRTGYVPAYVNLNASAKESLASEGPRWPGLEQDEDMVRWLWEQQFAAIVADNPGLECVRKYLH